MDKFQVQFETELAGLEGTLSAEANMFAQRTMDEIETSVNAGNSSLVGGQLGLVAKLTDPRLPFMHRAVYCFCKLLQRTQISDSDALTIVRRLDWSQLIARSESIREKIILCASYCLFVERGFLIQSPELGRKLCAKLVDVIDHFKNQQRILVNELSNVVNRCNHSHIWGDGSGVRAGMEIRTAYINYGRIISDLNNDERLLLNLEHFLIELRKTAYTTQLLCRCADRDVPPHFHKLTLTKNAHEERDAVTPAGGMFDVRVADIVTNENKNNIEHCGLLANDLCELFNQGRQPQVNDLFSELMNTNSNIQIALEKTRNRTSITDHNHYLHSAHSSNILQQQLHLVVFACGVGSVRR